MVAKARLGADNVLLLKPNTYMNRSGRRSARWHASTSSRPRPCWCCMTSWTLCPASETQAGRRARRPQRPEGHPGGAGQPNFWRLRIGIGHPRTLGLAQQVADFVLHPPRREEQTAIEAVIDRCRAVVPAMLAGDFPLATRQLHSGNDA